MPVFDVTHIVVGHGGDPTTRPDRFMNLMMLVDWLKEHVGEYYGTGEDHTDTPDLADTTSGSIAIRIGNGWQIERDWKGDPGGYVEVWWKLDITDEAKAVLFALKWIN